MVKNTQSIWHEQSNQDDNLAQTTSEVVFIDPTVPNYQNLIAGVLPGTEVIILGSTRDGVEQISELLAKHSNLSSVHIVSHGRPGSLQLGKVQLSFDALDSYTDKLQGWKDSLTNKADIFLYGCDVAAGDKGAAFVNRLSQLTGADVAASNDLTGSATLGRDWDLEVATGNIDAPLAFQLGVMRAYASVLAPFTVTNTNDSGAGSLRQAISNANNAAGADTIAFSGAVFTDATPDTITLTSGQLNITDSLTIGGTGASKLTISGNNASRVFNINATNVTLDGLTVANGKTTGINFTNHGGGISNNNGTLNITNSIIRNNQADYSGGIFNLVGNTLNITNSTVVNNTAKYDAGGIGNLNPLNITNSNALNITNSTVSGNTATNGAGGGIANFGPLNVTNSTLSGNSAAAQGGGIVNFVSNLSLTNSTITQNTADSDSNGLLGDGGGIANVNVFSNVKNTIIAENFDPLNILGLGSSPDVFGLFSSQGNNLIGKSNGGLGLGILSDKLGTISSPINPQLGPLQDNGGPTFTHALLSGSPAIDAGTNAGAPSTDQRGFNRSVDGNGDNTAITDIGAFEFGSPLTLSISPTAVSLNEGNSSLTAYNYTVSLSKASAQPVTLNYSTNDGTATTADGDYTDNDSSLTFNPGDPLSKTITVNVNGDVKTEGNENFNVSLNSVDTNNATIDPAANQSSGTIVNDDAAPTVSVSPATISQSEGNNGSTAYTYTVSLSNGSAQPVTVNYSTNDGTATTADGDYTDNDGNLIFNPGDSLSQTITINANPDSKFENGESFTLKLNSANNATINSAASQSSGDIANDDAAPSLSINDVTPNEANGTASFAVSLSAASGLPVTVNYATANDTATAGSDYTPVSGSLLFAAGVTSQSITVPVNDDTTDEADETFKVNLSNPTNATVADAQGSGTVVDNDPAPTVSVSPATIGQSEGSNGSTAFTYTVSLSNASSQPVTVNYSTNDGTATTADGDYTDNDSSLTFNPGGSLSQTITINANADSKVEGNETFFLQLTSATNATLNSAANQSSGVIANDDQSPLNDGAGGQKQFTVSQGSGTTTLTNFGGVGEGVNPSAAVIAEVDTLILQGTDLTATNLILIQNGPNVEVSFKGVANTKVILQNVALNNLDNLLKSSKASVDLGNILFNGQTTIQDSFDVFDANSTQTVLENRSTVTFLNDLNNSVNGFDDSNDVINAQGGNDRINGLSGNDLLRGGLGSDTLIGGTGNDLLAGDEGNDSLQGGTGVDQFFYNTDRPFTSADIGVDTLTDFVRGTDKLVLDKTTFTALDDGFSFQRVTSDAAAGTSSADIVYSSTSRSKSGKLFYNSNGIASGFGDGAQFATLTNLASPLTASDFLVIT